MFKKLYNKLFNKKVKSKRNTIEKLSEALHPIKDDISIEHEEITEHTIKGELYKLGDKVICRSNECDPLDVGIIVEFWDNNGKWTNPIPQVKVGDKVWCVMGIIKHYSEDLMEILKPMRSLEQWNYLLDDNVKEIYSYSEEEMDRKEKRYEKLRKDKELRKENSKK